MRQRRPNRICADTIAVLALAGCLVSAGCGDCPDSHRPIVGLHGYVTLENQTDHSGVRVAVAGTEHEAATDARGWFSLADVPDGQWELEAEYPYFASDTVTVELMDGLLESPVTLMLEQQVRFWVELEDTAAAISEPGSSTFRLDAQGYVQSLADETVRLVSISGCIPCLMALTKLGGELAQDCAIYGQLVPSECLPVFSAEIAPGEVRSYPVFGRYPAGCFEPGIHQVFWTYNDNGVHRHHFEAFTEYNQSLLRKPELIQPAIIRLTP